MVAVALLTVGLSARPAVASTTWYVDHSTCPASGNGSSTSPFCTIGAAAAVALPGDTVVVRSGTYAEEVKPKNSGQSGAPITYTTASGATVAVTGGYHGFTIDTKSWITVSGFTVSGTTGAGIYVKNSSNVTVSGDRVTLSGQPVSGSTAQGIVLAATTSTTVVGNTSDHNTDSGIYLDATSTGNEVRGNRTYSNARQYTRAAPGIDIRGPGNTVDRNVTYSNEDSGIQLYNGANNTVVFDNVSYSNGDHGIDCLNSTGQVEVSNTVYNNHTAGINVEGTSSGATLRNNISVDNGLTSTSTRGNIRVDANSVSGTTVDSDLVWLSSPGTMMTWGNTTYSSLAAMSSASGQERHGIQGDPLWVSPSNADFHLRGGSPAIDSADSSAPSEPTTDVEGNPRKDDPATPNTGLGPRGYDDRGAYELQPDFAPSAALTLSPSSGSVPLAVTANASGSTDGDATPIASYRFDFGDGTSVGPQSSATATHTYTNSGRYTVTVTVTDTAGNSGTATAVANAQSATGAPTAVLTVTPTSGPAPLAVTADASQSSSPDGTALTSYQFTFGDGSSPVTSSTPSATYTYPVQGTYQVSVTVTDAVGRTGTATATVTVQAGDNPPSAALTVSPSSGSAPLAVTADASQSTDTDAWPIATYAFDFGNGTTVGPQAGATAAHTYSGTGTYTVTVTVTDTNGLSGTATATVSVTTPNVVGNPGFETSLTGWNNSGYAGTLLARVAGGHSGSYAAQMSNTSTSTVANCLLNDAPNWVGTTTGGTYTASLWVRADTAGATLTLRLREYVGSTFVNQAKTSVVLSTGWQQVTVTYQPASPGTSTLDYNAYTQNSPPGTCFYADDSSITVG